MQGRQNTEWVSTSGVTIPDVTTANGRRHAFVGRPEDRDDRDTERGRQVHGPGVVRHERRAPADRRRRAGADRCARSGSPRERLPAATILSHAPNRGLRRHRTEDIGRRDSRERRTIVSATRRGGQRFAWPYAAPGANPTHAGVTGDAVRGQQRVGPRERRRPNGDTAATDRPARRQAPRPDRGSRRIDARARAAAGQRASAAIAGSRPSIPIARESTRGAPTTPNETSSAGARSASNAPAVSAAISARESAATITLSCPALVSSSKSGAMAGIAATATCAAGNAARTAPIAGSAITASPSQFGARMTRRVTARLPRSTPPGTCRRSCRPSPRRASGGASTTRARGSAGRTSRGRPCSAA